jgi:predicted Zn-dependent peptidase
VPPVPASDAARVATRAAVAVDRDQGLINTARLPSGLRVVTEHMPDVRSVSIGFWVGAGARDETPELAGASHFLEHLLFKGTPERSARQIAEVVDGLGGEMNAYTTKEYTAFYVRVLSDRLEVALDILCDIMSRPAFRPAEVEAERQVILEELLMHGDEPDELVHDLLVDALFPGHPLGRDVLGTEDTITAMTADQIAGFFNGHYGASNLVLAAAGAVDHEQLLAGIADRLAPPPGGAPQPRSAPSAAVEPARVVERHTEQAHLVVGMPSIDAHDPDRFALAALNHVLGGGLSSRLFQTIREERGLAYSVYSYRTAFTDAGALAVYAGTAPRHAGEVLDLINAELDRVAADGVTDAEVDTARAHLLGSTALSLEDSAARMGRIGRSLLVHDEVWTNAEVEAHMAGVTPDDVQRVIGRVLVDAPRIVAAIGPFDAATAEGLRAAS